MESQTAMDTSELRLGSAIRLLGMAAGRALATGVARINRDDWDTREFRLVGDKLPKFRKCPLPKPFAVSLPNRWLETFQVLQGNGPAGVFGRAHDGFGDAVVFVTLKSSLPTRRLLQMPLGRAGAAMLEILSQSVGPDSNSVHGFAGEKLTIRGRGDVGQPQVNPEGSFGVYRGSVRDFDADAEKEFTALEQQVRLAPNHLPMQLSIGSADHGEQNPTIQSQDAHPIQGLERKDALVINNGREFLELMLFFLLGFVGLRNFADGPDCHLGGQAKLIPDFPVGSMLEMDFAEPLICPSDAGNIVASPVEGPDRAKQGFPLFQGRQQLRFDRQVHATHCIPSSIGCQELFFRKEMADSSPRLRAGGFLGQTL